eukprot:m.8124 g.8124  ORF g.8124 m.8124 type:complete len:446 (+) comp5174_c0_seq1:133-1470(+)
MADDGIEESGAGPEQAMQVDTAVVGPPSFDFETYISAYTGRARTKRLRFIANHCPDLRKDALLLCLEGLRSPGAVNVRDLREVASELERAGWLPADYSEAATAKLAAQVKDQQDRLETEVKQSRSAVVKENVRVALRDLGNHLFDSGDFEGAFASFMRARDFCSQPSHLLEGFFSIIRTALELERWEQVATFSARALADKPQPGPASTLNALSGLAALVQGRYRVAATHFLEITLANPDVIKPYLSPRDIGLYVTLCALATFTRTELREKLIENPNFKHALEHTPEFRDILRDFLASRPRAWRAVLARVRNDLLLDVYLHAHVDALFALITEVALIQFVSPYISLDMNVIAEAFALSLPDLEQKLVALALSGKMNIRIDSNAKIVHKILTNERAATFAQALQTGRTFELHCQGLLVRSLMQRHQLTIENDQSTSARASNAHPFNF